MHTRSTLFALSCLLALIPLVLSVNWTPSESRPALVHSYASYCDKSKIQNWSCGGCKEFANTKFVGFIEDSGTSSFGYVAIDQDREIVISYRGSQCILNWYTNLNFFYTDFPLAPGTKVHKGFYETYKAVQGQTRNLVAKAIQSCPNCRTIRATGHSLGGALATHAVADLLSTHNQTHAVVATTFGSPRVGDPKFYQWFDAKRGTSWRLTHYADPVIHLPPRNLAGITYHHVALEVFEGSKAGSYKQCNGSGEDPSCANSILLPIDIQDHYTYMGTHLHNFRDNNCLTGKPNCGALLTKEQERAVVVSKLRAAGMVIEL